MTERKLFEHELEERLDAVLFASPSHRSITRLATTLESLPRVQQEKVLHWAGVAAKTYAESFGKDPAFYDFYRAMQSYRQTFLGENNQGGTSIIMSPDNEYLKRFSGG